MDETWAHLNGGPMDDCHVVVQGITWRVEVERPWHLSPAENPNPVVIEVVRGVYEKRRDSFGQPVPHDLAGCIEFDWKGWGA